MSRRPTELFGAPGAGADASSGESASAENLEGVLARAARVAELRRAVAAGRYRPDSREVASALLKSRARRALFGDDH